MNEVWLTMSIKNSYLALHVNDGRLTVTRQDTGEKLRLA